MHIIAHRGFWKSPEEKNTQIAFERAFVNGFGVETDFRDCMKRIIISHDLPSGDEMTAENFFLLYAKFSQAGLLAINIKADGLASSFTSLIKDINRQSYFMFDMAVPDMLSYHKIEIPFFTRVSDLESEPVLLSQAEGVWLDAIKDDWYGIDLINHFLSLNKKVAVVSPELHRRDYLDLWGRLKNECNIQHSLLSLCTDYPDRAKEYFNV